MICAKCKKDIKSYHLSKVVIIPTNFDGHIYYHRETFHKGCAPKQAKKKKDDDENTSNVMYV